MLRLGGKKKVTVPGYTLGWSLGFIYISYLKKKKNEKNISVLMAIKV